MARRQFTQHLPCRPAIISDGYRQDEPFIPSSIQAYAAVPSCPPEPEASWSLSHPKPGSSRQATYGSQPSCGSAPANSPGRLCWKSWRLCARAARGWPPGNPEFRGREFVDVGRHLKRSLLPEQNISRQPGFRSSLEQPADSFRGRGSYRSCLARSETEPRAAATAAG